MDYDIEKEAGFPPIRSFDELMTTIAARDKEIAELRAEVERLREAATKASLVLNVKQPDKLDDARSLLMEALAARKEGE